MKKVALIGGLLALLGAGSAYALGQFPDYPLATASPQTGYTATLPLTGNERVPADTTLGQGINPQTEVISTGQLRAYVLSGSSVATYVLPSILTIATLPTCTAALQGALATVSNGTAYGTGTYGSAVSATGAVTRVVACTNTAGATTYAWAYN